MNPLLGLLAGRVQGTPLGGLLGLIDGAPARGGMRQGSSDGTRTMEMRPEMLDAYRETPRTMEMRPEMAGAYIVEPLGRSGPPAAHRTAPPPPGRSEAAWGEAPDPGPLPMQGLPASIVRTESGGDWGALNSEGYGGRGQFGTARLADAYRAGVIPRPMTGAEYSRAPAEVQLAVENWHRNDILGQLGRYVGTDVDGSGPIPPLTENSLLGVAHLGGTGGARRFIESGGRYDPADSNGTNLSDYAMTHAGGGSMSNASTGGAPVGLLGSSRPQGGGLLGRAAPAPLTAMPAPERRRSIFDRLEGVPLLGGLADPDRRARLQIALEGMTLNPNQGLIEMAQGDIADGREQERLARTAAWLAENGGQDFAAALMAGVDPAQAVGGFMESRQPQEPINAGGGLFLDPVTLEPVADYRQSEGAGLTEVSPGATLYDPTTGQEVYRAPAAQGEGQDPTAAMQNYEYLTMQGVPQEEAMERAFGGGGVTVNTGESSPLVGTIPPGHALVEDPDVPGGYRMVPIPGGPAAAEVAAAEGQQAATEAAQATTGDVITTAAIRARDAAQERAVGGLLGRGMSRLPGTSNAEVYRQVDVLKANATIESLNAMRQQSPTGGALGNVTEGEGRMLADRAGTLDPASPNFERDLADFTRTLLRTIHGPEAGDAIFAQTYGAASDAPPEGAASGNASMIPQMSADDLLALDLANLSPAEVAAWNDRMAELGF